MSDWNPKYIFNVLLQFFYLSIVTAFPFLIERVTYLVLAGGKTTTKVGISSDEQNDFKRRHSAANTSGRNNRPNTPQQNEFTCRSFHFSTDKPSLCDTIIPKKIRKVTIQHQRRRGKNRQTLSETN